MSRVLSRLSAILPAYLTGSTPSPAPTLSRSLKSPQSSRMASTTSHTSNGDGAEVNDTPAQWRAELDALPSLEELGGRIPSVFLAHGQPMLITPPRLAAQRGGPLAKIQGPDGLLVQFLRDLGPHLLDKYRPRAIVVLSAHWETPGGGMTTDYGDENPLLMDYFGFPEE